MDAPSATFTPPYPPSWIDRLIDWIDRLRMPNWLFYIVLLILELLVFHASEWLRGFLPVGQFDVYSLVVLYNVFGLAWIHYLRDVADRALTEFLPALGVTETEYARIKYEVHTLPAKPVLSAMVLGLLFTLISFLFPQSPEAASIQLSAEVIIAGGSGLALTGVIFYQGIRYVRMVSRVHRQAARLNLFQFAPLYAFSAITVRIGLIGVISPYINFALDPTSINSLPFLALNGSLLALGAAAFVLPLYGMHQRIVVEKKRLLSEHDRRFESVVNELNQHIDARNLEQMDVLTRTMNSLVIQREVLNKIPTWPWRTVTFRGFATTLLLPLVVWLITRLLSRLGL